MDAKEGIQERKDQSKQYAEKDKEQQKKERRDKIEESRYWPLYKYIRCVHLPQYLTRPLKEREVLARWRYGNEIQTWLKGECAKCSSEDLSINHRLVCHGYSEVNTVEILYEDGRGLQILMEIMENERK